MVAGPGLGADSIEWIRERLTGVSVPVVLDADGLDRSLIPSGTAHAQRWVLTPHEGEFVRLTGEALPDSSPEAASLAATDCVVLKGATTLISDRDGHVRVVRSGTPTLASATAGSDVLSGVIGATIARGHDPLDAAALGAHLHGRAGASLPVYASASDIPSALSDIIAVQTGAESSPIHWQLLEHWRPCARRPVVSGGEARRHWKKEVVPDAVLEESTKLRPDSSHR